PLRDALPIWERHPALTMGLDDVTGEAAASGRLLLVDGEDTPAASRAATLAQASHIPTLIDVEEVRPGTVDLLHQIDAIIAAEEFPSALTGDRTLGRALEAMGREFRAGVVCVTLG